MQSRKSKKSGMKNKGPNINKWVGVLFRGRGLTLSKYFWAIILLQMLAVSPTAASKSSDPAFKDALYSLCKNNYLKALNELEPLAKDGHLEAQYQLGKLLTSYDTDPEIHDNEKGRVWLYRAAKRGHTKAEYAYAYALPSEETYSHGMKYIFSAARKGHQAAQNSLGNKYRTGVGTPLDYYNSSLWYLRAAQQLDQDEPGLALHNLLHNYQAGYHPDSKGPLGYSSGSKLRDLVLFLDPYKRSQGECGGISEYPEIVSTSGYIYGNISQLASMFRKGKGVPKNLYAAISLYKKLDQLQPGEGHWKNIYGIYKELRLAEVKKKKAGDSNYNWIKHREFRDKEISLLRENAGEAWVRETLCWQFLRLASDKDYSGEANINAYLWCSLTDLKARPELISGEDLFSRFNREMTKSERSRAKILTEACIRRAYEKC